MNGTRMYRVEWDDVEIHHRESLYQALDLARGPLLEGRAVTIIPVMVRVSEEDPTKAISDPT